MIAIEPGQVWSDEWLGTAFVVMRRNGTDIIVYSVDAPGRELAIPEDLFAKSKLLHTPPVPPLKK